ncbi:MAG: ATP-binding protein [Gemmatimonadales bacterium]
MIARTSIVTQLRLLGLIAAIGVVVVVGTEHALLRGARQRFDEEQTQLSVRRAREALTRTIAAERQRITETAWWDEAYAYMPLPDGAPAARAFEKTNLLDWLPAQYGDEFIGVWRPDRKPRFLWTAPAVAGIDTVLPVTALLNRLDTRQATAGFLELDHTLWFVTGAMILPNSGGAPGTPPRGYLVAARRVGTGLASDLATSLQEDVQLRPAAAFARDKVVRQVVAGGDTTSTTLLVPNFFERRAVEMELKAPRAFLAGLESWSARFLGMVLLLSAALLALVAYFARRLVVQPFRWLGAHLGEMRRTNTLARLPEGPRPAKDWSLLIEQFNALADERESATRALATARDEALEATRAKSEFLANMSHEIRTPMNAIIGFSDLLKQTELSEEQREYTGLVVGAAESLLHIINQILDLSKVEAGKVVLEEVPFNLHRLVGEAMMLFAPRARERGVALRTSIAPDVPRTVVGDAGRVRQVLINLIGNALKFTEQGEVLLAVEAVPGSGGLVRFRVKDSGIGIPPEKLAAVFEKFTQADASTTRRYGGTGLGLAIVREIVKLMQGEVAVESTVGSGSTFSFTARLPLAESEDAAAEPEPEQAPAISVGGWRVLVVDDNEVNRMVARAYLQRLGCEIEVVAGGVEAVERVRRGGLDLVFMDVQMPEVDGFEATRRIRALPAPAGRTRVVAMTANAMQGDRERCLAAGMDDYVSKPIREPELVAALRRIDPAGPPSALAGTAPEPAIFDASSLKTLAAGTADGLTLVHRLVDLFTADAERQLGDMRAASARGDWALLGRRAHTLKGSSGTLGLAGLAAALGMVEVAVREADHDAARAAAERLPAAAGPALAAIREWRGGPPAIAPVVATESHAAVAVA